MVECRTRYPSRLEMEDWSQEVTGVGLKPRRIAFLNWKVTTCWSTSWADQMCFRFRDIPVLENPGCCYCCAGTSMLVRLVNSGQFGTSCLSIAEIELKALRDSQ